MVERHETEVADLNRVRQRELDEASSAHGSRVRQLQDDHAVAVAALERRHADEVERVRRELETEFERTTAERVERVEEELETVRARLDAERSKWQGEKESLERDLEVSFSLTFFGS